MDNYNNILKISITILWIFILFLGCEKDKMNNPPVINELTANGNFETKNIEECEEFTFHVTASDEDGDNLTFSWSCDEGEFTGSTNSSQVIWQAPDILFDPGSTTQISQYFSVKVSVNDGKETVTKSLEGFMSKFSYDDISCDGSLNVVTSPKDGDIWQTGNSYNILWDENYFNDDWVQIQLYKDSERILYFDVQNDGNYDWDVPTDLEPDIYKIKITTWTYEFFSDEFQIIEGNNQNTYTEINEDFSGEINNTEISITDWLNIAEEGSRLWLAKEYGGNLYAQATAYNSTDNNNIYWLLTPLIDFDVNSGEILSFKSAQAYWYHNGLSVWLIKDLNGSDISSASKIELYPILADQNSPEHEWVNSGSVNLSNFTGLGRIGFRYEGSSTNGETTTYRIDDVVISSDSDLNADFEANSTSVLVGETVYFTDLSSGNPTGWAWAFGDDHTSTSQNPAHSYSSPGTYSVLLYISDGSNNDTEYKENYITVSSGSQTGTVTDYDGNVYNTVKIGNQWWMAENLKTTHYANGVDIQVISSSSSWSGLDTDDKAMCYYNNSSSNAETYGALYTWAAAMNGIQSSNSNPSGIRGVCPYGWHMPSNAEWNELEDYLGGEFLAGGKMKEIGTSHWNSPNSNATNESGFTGIPGGHRYYYGDYGFMGSRAYFWSSALSNGFPYYYELRYNDGQLHYDAATATYGRSVRCVKD
jgi:uncharacterized protein (TIGR02145 family)